MEYKINLIPPLSKTSSVLNAFYIKIKEILMYCEMRGDNIDTTLEKVRNCHNNFLSQLTDKRSINNFTCSFEVNNSKILVFDDWGCQGNVIIEIY